MYLVLINRLNIMSYPNNLKCDVVRYDLVFFSIAFLLVFACLSLCLLARLLKNACMDLDEMLHVDRRRYMDELINF